MIIRIFVYEGDKLLWKNVSLAQKCDIAVQSLIVESICIPIVVIIINNGVGPS